MHKKVGWFLYLYDLGVRKQSEINLHSGGTGVALRTPQTATWPYRVRRCWPAGEIQGVYLQWKVGWQ